MSTLVTNNLESLETGLSESVDSLIEDRVIRVTNVASPTATFKIPTDYSDLQAAVDDLSDKYGSANSTIIDINIEAGHALTKGLRCANGQYNNFRITSDDAVVYLAAGFSPAVPQADDALNTSGYTGTMMFLGFNATMPELRCLIDMEKFVADGMNLGSRSSAFISAGSGVKNAGERGLVCWSNCNVAGRGSLWSGANDEGVRVQGACTADLRSAIINDCMLNPIVGNAALYISRSSVVEFRGGSATGSGSDGILVRRSLLTAGDANLSTSNQNTFESGFEGKACLVAQSLATVDCTGATLSGGVRGLWASDGATVSAGGATATGNGIVDIYIASGATVIGDPTTTNGSGGTDLSDVTFSPSGGLKAFNLFSSKGTFINTNAPDAIVKGSSGSHVWYKYSDGRMEYYVNAETIDTGEVLSGEFSGQVAKPTLNETFVDLHSTQIEAIGKGGADGGGGRIGVYLIGRTQNLTDPLKVFNTGVETDGAGTALIIRSIQIQWSIFGTWK